MKPEVVGPVRSVRTERAEWDLSVGQWKEATYNSLQEYRSDGKLATSETRFSSECATKCAHSYDDAGALIDVRESRYGATPIGFAIYYQRTRMMDLLSLHSRDLWNLALLGAVERVRDVLGTEPGLAKLAWPSIGEVIVQNSRLSLAASTAARAVKNAP